MIFLAACVSLSIPAPTTINNSTMPFRLIELRKSIVKISAFNKIEFKNKKTGIIKTSTLSALGTGGVFKNIDNQTIILTADHICNIGIPEIQSKFINYDKELFEIKVLTLFQVTKYSGENYFGIKLLSNNTAGLCAIVFQNLNLPPLIPAFNVPVLGDKIHYMGYPKGIWSAGYTPFFSGYYAGSIAEDNLNAAAYSVPSTTGCSGSPILNDYGELIGLVSGYIVDFNDLTIGPTLIQIKEFLIISEMHYKKYQKSIQEFFIKSS